jgi:hypothetical protein
MRTLLLGAVCCCFLVLPGWAQRGGGRGASVGSRAGAGFNGARGFNVGFRGGMGGGALRGGGFGRIGGGFREGVGFNRRFGFGTRAFFSYPFVYPGFSAAFYDPWLWDGWNSSYSYGYPGAGSFVGNSYYEPPAIVINQGFRPEIPNPEVRDYPAPPPPATQAQAYEAPLYLIAFTDGIIRPALAYWVEGDTLHYVTMDRDPKQAALSTVDRDLSERLNRERRVTFRLPR